VSDRHPVLQFRSARRLTTSREMHMKPLALWLSITLLAAACSNRFDHGGRSGGSDTDTGADGDTDADAGTDTDTDSDSDTATDTGADKSRAAAQLSR
jgi:hypothetical protein